MYKVLTDKKKIKKAHQLFSSQIIKNADATLMPILGTQGGNVEATTYYSLKHDLWFCPLPGYNKNGKVNRYWNAFGIGKPEDGQSTSIICEINVPTEDINRHIGAVFAEDFYGNIVLLHRGKIGGGRKGIGKSLFLKHYMGTFVEAEDDDQVNEFALIGIIDSKRIIPQIAAFVREIDRIKNGESIQAVQTNDNTPIFSPEFSGVKKVRGRKAIEAQVNHGIIVEQLHDELKAMGHQVANDQYIDLFIFAENEVEHIFEVKPDLSNSNLYSGIGQLVVYSAGHKGELHLVVPEGLSDEMKEHLKNFDVNVLEYQMNDGKVTFNNLSQFQK